MPPTIDYLQMPDGARLRLGVWHPEHQSPCGSVLLLSGRTEFLEKYDETARELNRRGCTVWGFDWRGQGLSGRPLADRRKGHIDTYETYLADLERVYAHLRPGAGTAPLTLLAHSMGAHLALRFLHDHPGAVSRAVLTAPLVGIHALRGIAPGVHLLCRLAVRLGKGTAYFPGGGAGAGRDLRFEGNRLTSDRSRFARTRTLLASNPDLALGGPTWGWLKATLDALGTLTRPGFAAGITAPVLMVLAGAERIVCNRAAASLAASLPNCRLMTVAGSRHEILVEADPLRRAFWQAYDRFVPAGQDAASRP